MEQCLISGCKNEARLIAKSGGKSYYSCKEHRNEVAQIVASEMSKGEKSRSGIVAEEVREEIKKRPPKWLGF